MTNRQAALLAYVATIAPQVRGAKTVDEYTSRILACVREDGAFLATGFARAALERARTKSVDVLEEAIGFVEDSVMKFFNGLRKER